jgi:hypothetical protein
MTPSATTERGVPEEPCAFGIEDRAGAGETAANRAPVDARGYRRVFLSSRQLRSDMVDLLKSDFSESLPSGRKTDLGPSNFRIQPGRWMT